MKSILRFSPLLLTLLLPLLSGCGGEGFEPVDAGEVVSFSVSERIPTLREKTATKAPKVYTGAAADVQALDFAVWAYNMPSAGSLPADWRLDGGTGSTPVKASYNSEKNDWRPAGNIKYNSSSRAATWQTRWFALGPWAACNGSTANVSGLTPADGSAPRPRYTVPSGSLVATRHYDLLAAVSADRAVGTTTPVALNFCHVLTGIRFKREKDLNITDITVSGVYDRADLAMEKIPADGDLTAFVNVDNEGDDADLWSGRTRSVATPSFSVAPVTWTNGRPGNPDAETQWDYAASDGDILMMIPQFTPAGAKITVTIDGVPVAGDISGHRWLPGRLVTYAITRGDDFLTWELSALGEDIIWENEYIFEGTVPATLSYPAEGGELTLATAFRSCIEDGEQTVPESFVFQYSADGTGDWTDGLPDWLSSPGTSLDGAATATTLSLTAAANDSGAARTVHVRLLQTNTGKVITPSCQITQQNVPNYILEGTVPATQSVAAAGETVTFATNFLSYKQDGGTATKEAFEFQYSATGDDDSWTDGLPDWLTPPADQSGATTATTLRLTVAGKTGITVRSMYVRLQQPASGKTTSACEILQFPPGKFTVSDGKRVIFSWGNVQYRASTKTWRFAEHQWDYVGGTRKDGENIGTVYEEGVKSNNLAISATYDGWIDLFGWATTGVQNENGGDYGYDPYHTNFYPYSIGYYSHTPFKPNVEGYGPSCGETGWAFTDIYNISETSVNAPTLISPYYDESTRKTHINNTWNANDNVRRYCDWGVHFNEAGNGLDSRINGAWFTLSDYEWRYLLYSRPRASELRAVGSIYNATSGMYIYGLLLLPDNWALPAGCAFVASTSYDLSNSYVFAGDGTGTWDKMEAAGAVFLPSAGTRFHNNDGTLYLANLGEPGITYNGFYWSSTPYTSSNYFGVTAHHIVFGLSGEVGKGSVSVGGASDRQVGKAVRLVFKVD